MTGLQYYDTGRHCSFQLLYSYVCFYFLFAGQCYSLGCPDTTVSLSNMILISQPRMMADTDISLIQYKQEWFDIQLYLYVFKVWISSGEIFEV